MAEQTVVFIYPYLPIRSRAEVGPWQLIPVGDIADDDASSDWVATGARGLARLYEVEGTLLPLGAFALPPAGRIGDHFDRSLMKPLTRAILVAFLEDNPDPLLPEEERSGNKGHSAIASDNAIGAPN